MSRSLSSASSSSSRSSSSSPSPNGATNHHRSNVRSPSSIATPTTTRRTATSFAAMSFSPSSTNSNNVLPRVHGHDHNRPLPPPRLPGETTTSPLETGSTTTIVPMTLPLTPLTSGGHSISVVRTRSPRTPAPSPTQPTDNRIASSTPSSALQRRHATTIGVGGTIHDDTNGIGRTNTTTSTSTSTSTTTTATTTTTTTTTGLASEVTLAVPRPDGERVVNEYVESPFRSSLPSSQKCPKSDHHHHHHHRRGGGGRGNNTSSNFGQSRNRNQQSHHQYHHNHNHNNHNNHNNQRNQNQIESQNQNRRSNNNHRGICGNSNSSTTNSTLATKLNNRTSSSSIFSSSIPIVTKQPISFTKEPANSIGSVGSLTGSSRPHTPQQTTRTSPNQLERLPDRGGLDGSILPTDENLSIMCDYCGRCRCEACREPPPLPSRWLCNNACFCSAETALDYASCLCCVKGLFYHCSDAGSGADSEGEGAGGCADEPCSCTGSRRQARWACLGVLAPVLPCLLCYWPFKGCVALCEACYARHASQGCRCDPSTIGGGRHLGTTTLRDSRDPEKRLLDPVTPEL